MWLVSKHWITLIFSSSWLRVFQLNLGLNLFLIVPFLWKTTTRRSLYFAMVRWSVWYRIGIWAGISRSGIKYQEFSLLISHLLHWLLHNLLHWSLVLFAFLKWSIKFISNNLKSVQIICIANCLQNMSIAMLLKQLVLCESKNNILIENNYSTEDNASLFCFCWDKFHALLFKLNESWKFPWAFSKFPYRMRVQKGWWHLNGSFLTLNTNLKFREKKQKLFVGVCIWLKRIGVTLLKPP